MKILFITVQDIYSKISIGGQQCSQRNYRLLSEKYGEENVYAVIISENMEGTIKTNTTYFKYIKNEFQAFFAALMGCKRYPYKEEKRILRYINKLCPDMVFLDTSVLGKLSKKIECLYKIIFFHNIESEYSKNKVKNQSIKYLPSYWSSIYNEKLAIKHAANIICLNKRDSDLLYKKYERSADLLLPISFPDMFCRNSVNVNCNDKKLLFVGSFFPPNVNGIRWFVTEVMSQLKEFKLVIVGRDFETVRGELERDNVEVIGTVERIDYYYYHFPVVVMPILYGDGMKVKTAEAMMYGKTIFATDEALEGYNTVSGIYRCNTVDDFVNQIRMTFLEKKINPVNDEVRDYYLNNHEISKSLARLNLLLKTNLDS